MHAALAETVGVGLLLILIVVGDGVTDGLFSVRKYSRRRGGRVGGKVGRWVDGKVRDEVMDGIWYLGGIQRFMESGFGI